MERQFASVVKGVARAVRIFLHRQREEVEVLAAALGRIRVVRHEEGIGFRPNLLDAPIRNRILMAGMMPAVAVASVDLFVAKPDPASPVEQIPKPRGLSELPDALDLFSPPRFQNLV